MNNETRQMNNENDWDLLNEINEMFNDIEGSQYDTPEEKIAREQRVAAAKAEREIEPTEPEEEMVGVFGPYDIADDEDDEEIVVGYHWVAASQVKAENHPLSKKFHNVIRSFWNKKSTNDEIQRWLAEFQAQVPVDENGTRLHDLITKILGLPNSEPAWEQMMFLSSALTDYCKK